MDGDADFRGVEEREGRLAVQYMADDTYHEEIVESAEDAIQFYTDKLKPENHDEQFYIGEYSDALLDNDQWNSGRGKDGEWYVDIGTVCRNAYLQTAIDVHGDVPDEDRERLAAELAENGKYNTVEQIWSLFADDHVPDDRLQEQVVYDIARITLEEVVHAVNDQPHPLELTVAFDNPDTQERIHEAVDTAYDEYLETGGDDTLQYQMPPEEYLANQDAIAEELSDMLTENEKQELDEYWQVKTVRGPWDAVFHDVTAAVSSVDDG